MRDTPLGVSIVMMTASLPVILQPAPHDLAIMRSNSSCVCTCESGRSVSNTSYISNSSPAMEFVNCEDKCMTLSLPCCRCLGCTVSFCDAPQSSVAPPAHVSTQSAAVTGPYTAGSWRCALSRASPFTCVDARSAWPLPEASVHGR